jgi:hypothetical protein
MLLLEELFLSQSLPWALLAPPLLLALTCLVNMSLKLTILSSFSLPTLLTVHNSFDD